MPIGLLVVWSSGLFGRLCVRAAGGGGACVSVSCKILVVRSVQPVGRFRSCGGSLCVCGYALFFLFCGSGGLAFWAVNLWGVRSGLGIRSTLGGGGSGFLFRTSR